VVPEHATNPPLDCPYLYFKFVDTDHGRLTVAEPPSLHASREVVAVLRIYPANVRGKHGRQPSFHPFAHQTLASFGDLGQGSYGGLPS
jgi:hypothetical protein